MKFASSSIFAKHGTVSIEGRAEVCAETRLLVNAMLSIKLDTIGSKLVIFSFLFIVQIISRVLANSIAYINCATK